MELDPLTLKDHLWHRWHVLRMRFDKNYRREWDEFENLIREAYRRGVLK